MDHHRKTGCHDISEDNSGLKRRKTEQSVCCVVIHECRAWRWLNRYLCSEPASEFSDKILRRSSFETFLSHLFCVVERRKKSKSGITTSIGSVGGSIAVFRISIAIDWRLCGVPTTTFFYSTKLFYGCDDATRWVPCEAMRFAYH